MKNRAMPLCGCALALALLTVGCGASGNAASTTAAMAADTYNESYAVEESAADRAAGGMENGSVELGENAATTESARKIVYNASISMESTAFSDAQTALLKAVADAGGYVESSSVNGSAEEQNRSAWYTARIPAQSYRAFLANACTVGNVTSQSENAEDITSSYIDVEARLAALETQRDRLNALAEKAETTADLLEIESQLSDVQYELESYTRQLRAMDDVITYSTVDVNLTEVAVLTPTSSSFGSRLTNAFSGGWTAFVTLAQGFVLALIYLWPLLLLAAVVGGVIVAAVRSSARRKAAKAAAQPAVKEAQPAPPPADAPGGDDPPAKTPTYRR